MPFALMKTSIALFCCLIAINLLAQDTSRTNVPARRSAPAVVSPEIHKDRTVTFRLRALAVLAMLGGTLLILVLLAHMNLRIEAPMTSPPMPTFPAR